jgi:hypothetical protein
MSSSNRIPVSWKKIAVGLPVFLVLFFLSDRGLFNLFLGIEKSDLDRFGLEEKLRAIPGKEKYEVLVLGTSRTFNAVQPKFVNPVIGTRLFKESSIGKGPKYNYYFYRMYKKIFGVPKVVVYGLDYFTFTTRSRPTLLQRFPECTDVPNDYSQGPSLLLANKERIDQYVNSLLNRFQDKAPVKSRPFEPEKNFADMEEFTGSIPQKDTKVVTEIPPDFNKKKAPYAAFPGQEGAYFIKLLRELKKDKVAIFLITIPDYIGTYRTHRGNRRFVQDHANLLKILNYEGHAFLADYNSPKRFPMEDVDCFVNGGYGQVNCHLSQKGSEIFCRMFAKDLKSILDGQKSR